MHMRVACKTDRGKMRPNNEDSVLVDESNAIFLLADGLGGHQAGEVASELAVKEAYAYLKDIIERAGASRESPGFPTDSLKEAVSKAHYTVKERAGTDPHLTGMGATLEIMLIKNNSAYIGHVGDSRAYIMRDGIKQITRDHTAEGYLSVPAVMPRGRRAPAGRSHMLAQAVGTSRVIHPDTHHINLQAGDIMLLCTDGLTDMLADEEIAGFISMYRDDMDHAAAQLIHAANTQGGLDNITVVLVKV